MKLSLNRVILYVQDVRRATKFYRDNLGLSVIEESTDDWAVLQAGHCELELHRAGQVFRTSSANSSTSNSNAKLVMTISGDIEVLRTELIANDVTIGEIKSYLGFTGLMCDGVDPEGNVFQLSQAKATWATRRSVPRSSPLTFYKANPVELNSRYTLPGELSWTAHRSSTPKTPGPKYRG